MVDVDQKRKYLFLWLLISGGVFILISGIVLIILNQPSNSTKASIPTSVDDVPRVTVSDAKAALDAGTAVFVDVRDSDSYEAAHIPGALLIPFGDLTNRMNELDPSRWIITYCT